VARREAPGRPVAGEARHAAALTEALASGDAERIRKALQAVRDWPENPELQLEVQPGDDAGTSGNEETAGKRGGAGGARTHDRQIMSPLL
jgi:hypothetical protein